MSDAIDVLYVDADPAAESTADALERAHDRLCVLVASGVEEALDRLADEAVDCVAGVHRPPDADGFVLLDAVRAASPDLPFVLLDGTGPSTAGASTDATGGSIAEEALDRGATDCLRVRGGDGGEPPALLAARIANAGGRYAAERRLRALLAEPADYLLVVDAEGTVEFATPSVERVLGHEPSALVGRGVSETVLPEDRDDARACLEAAVDDPGTDPTAEVRVRHGDGSLRWVELSVRNRTDDPAVAGIVVAARDVTERRETEAEVDWHRTIVRHMDEGIYVVDSEHVFRFVDYRTGGADEQVGDWTGEAVSHLAATGVLSEAEVASIEASVDELLADGADEVRIELRPSLPPDVGTVELRMTPITGPDGERLVLGTTRDITTRVEREAELQRQNERLDEFASIVSHDLRSPLNVADGRIRLADAECDSDELAAALDALGRMDEIIEGTLALARQGDRVGDPEPVELSALATDCWDRVETADATVTVEADATVRADPEQLSHVFENLFRNSVEHGSTGSRTESGDSVEQGSADGRAGTDGDDPVTIRVGTLDDRAGFYLADDGPGIPVDERERVFETGYSSSPDGTGFGLAIVREIVQAHGWDVRATESAEGGARFEITGVTFEE